MMGPPPVLMKVEWYGDGLSFSHLADPTIDFGLSASDYFINVSFIVFEKLPAII